MSSDVSGFDLCRMDASSSSTTAATASAANRQSEGTDTADALPGPNENDQEQQAHVSRYAFYNPASSSSTSTFASDVQHNQAYHTVLRRPYNQSQRSYGDVATNEYSNPPQAAVVGNAVRSCDAGTGRSHVDEQDDEEDDAFTRMGPSEMGFVHFTPRTARTDRPSEVPLRTTTSKTTRLLPRDCHDEQGNLANSVSQQPLPRNDRSQEAMPNRDPPTAVSGQSCSSSVNTKFGGHETQGDAQVQQQQECREATAMVDRVRVSPNKDGNDALMTAQKLFPQFVENLPQQWNNTHREMGKKEQALQSVHLSTKEASGSFDSDSTVVSSTSTSPDDGNAHNADRHTPVVLQRNRSDTQPPAGPSSHFKVNRLTNSVVYVTRFQSVRIHTEPSVTGHATSQSLAANDENRTSSYCPEGLADNTNADTESQGGKYLSWRKLSSPCCSVFPVSF